jgi:hypothetical protein
MKATLLLADAANVADGKFNMLGGGWSVTTGALPSALVAKIEVPWNQANEQIALQIRLLDADGNELIEISKQFEVGRPPGIPAGMAIDHLEVVNFGPLPMLKPGQFHVWELRLNGETTDDWRCTFWVRPSEGNIQAA